MTTTPAQLSVAVAKAQEAIEALAKAVLSTTDPVRLVAALDEQPSGAIVRDKHGQVWVKSPTSQRWSTVPNDGTWDADYIARNVPLEYLFDPAVDTAEPFDV